MSLAIGMKALYPAAKGTCADINILTGLRLCKLLIAEPDIVATTTKARMRHHATCLLQLPGEAKLSTCKRLQIGGICCPRVWHGGSCGWWWWPTVDCGGSQRQMPAGKLMLAADGWRVVDGGAREATDGGGSGSGNGIKKMGGGLLILNNIIIG